MLTNVPILRVGGRELECVKFKDKLFFKLVKSYNSTLNGEIIGFEII